MWNSLLKMLKVEPSPTLWNKMSTPTFQRSYEMDNSFNTVNFCHIFLGKYTKFETLY